MFQTLIICGNLGKDAETRTAGQATIASFSVACTERYKDAQGQFQETTEWFECEYWNAANVTAYLKKGTTVLIEGSIRTDKWQGQDGSAHERKKVRVRSLKLVGGRPQQTQAPQQYAPAPMPQYVPQPQQYAPAPQPQYPPQQAQAPQQAQFKMPGMDDIPF